MIKPIKGGFYMLDEKRNEFEEEKESETAIDETIERYKSQQPFVRETVVNNRKEKKGHPWLIWTLVTALLCGTCSYATAKYVSKQIIEKANEKQVVIYQNTNVDSVVPTVTPSSDLSGVVEGVKNTVVEVYTESVRTSAFYGEYVTSGAGSGVIISEDGYIITNNHVIDGARSIRVALHDGSDYSAVLIGKDAELDLAIIKIDEKGLQPAVFGDSTKLKVGETCIAIGNPLGTLGGTVTSGLISALSRDVTIEGNRMTLLQTDTTINPGNSGGGLFNTSGQLIGIVNAKYSSDSIEGIGFAIPINTVTEVLNDLITNGRITGKAIIGIKCTSIENERYQNYYGLTSNGVYINEVTMNNAMKGGLKAGDLIIQMDSYKITSYDDLKAALNKYKAGDTVVITVLRGNESIDCRVTLAERTAE